MSDKEKTVTKSVTILAETATTIAKYADKNELSVGEAIDKLIYTADSRLKALARYAKNKEPMAPGKPRVKKAKAAAKPKKAKAAAKKAASPKPKKDKAPKAAKKESAANGLAPHAQA